MRLITVDGNRIISTESALRIAKNRGLDLILVSPDAHPPVCKIADYGKMMYEQKKREKENRKKQHKVEVQEIRFRPNVGKHDYENKLNKIKEFLTKGVKLKVTVMFRGRELAHPGHGAELLKHIVEDCEELIKSAEFENYTEGSRRMHLIIQS
ncbi:MAG: translation initiation factor IF-3 [Candidatus Marinimicrobia bacterium]|nr:translation initiation factor IF-3 [Candidatus Neomarinimicrobiota bacterium]